MRIGIRPLKPPHRVASTGIGPEVVGAKNKCDYFSLGGIMKYYLPMYIN